MSWFAKKTRVLVVCDDPAVLAKLRARVELFWPADIPVKTLAVFCGWADEAIDSIKDYRPDVLLLTHAFRRDEKTGRDVARWIDEHYRAPIHVAVHGDVAEAELRRLFEGVRCVSHFIAGEGVREFIRDCTRPERAEG
ncbi:MAG: hypothetical protein IT293_05660 [Deltaproteobacteria bacterium]|nr:hypothetical protein [Deltaproteobacteria bacterium]